MLLVGFVWITGGIYAVVFDSILGPYITVYLLNIPYPTIMGGFIEIIIGTLSLIVGILSKISCKSKIESKEFLAVRRLLLILGILGSLAIGGIAILAQYFLIIKIGGFKTRNP